MQTFTVISKETGYFKCLKNGYHCRIVIDDFSKNLPLGDVQLHVEEVTNKYEHHASDAVFRLTLPYAQQSSIAICTMKPGKKNRFTYAACMRLGGKWEPILNEWVFSASVEDKVRELEAVIHSRQIVIQADFRENITVTQKPLTLFGFELVKSVGIDYAPVFYKGIRLVSGNIAHIITPPKRTIVEAGTGIRLQVPEAMLTSAAFKEDYIGAVDISKKRKL
ncbi:hypothetical protein L3Q72_13915 [Vibrio sp. JC009]|uniref:hypothetical protein n=1 Tax=Vibrio sp. JC009 TaxID=2912314 RepID=UPI0023AE7C89|nr:hypothetical protein [Vibrio sp. JC009]WED21690.1 hypothetical protein L3Q72_13915 [Vibrio sp. JC009]